MIEKYIVECRCKTYRMRKQVDLKLFNKIQKMLMDFWNKEELTKEFLEKNKK